MKIEKLKFPFLFGLLLILINLVINLATINDYGVTWDFTYHFNMGLWHLKLPLQDPSITIGPSPPLSDIFPTLTYIAFFKNIKLLSWDAAYNLYGVAIGSIGIGILYFIAADLLNWKIALISSLTLTLLPRYMGHLHNNMKDIPQAVFFTLALHMFWRLYHKQKVSNLVIASLTFALAFNTKVNAIFILVISAIFLILISFSRYWNSKYQRGKISFVTISYFVTAPLFALLLWWPFWDNPFARLIEAEHSYTTSTTNMPIFYFGQFYQSGVNVPWHYPFGVLGVTTPIIVLFLYILGLGIILKKINKGDSAALFILLWFLIPLSRYLKPHMIVIDDIRHFMEILYPLALISAIGIYHSYDFLNKKIFKNLKIAPFPNWTASILVTAYLLYLSYQNISYHPFQTSYYNEIIGGIKGADKKFDIDFWASSYKQAMQYLNDNAPLQAKITVAMAPDIAKLYLRNDLQLKLNQTNLNYAKSYIYSDSDYTVILNRQSFFNWYNIPSFLQKNIPVFTVEKYGIPLVWIFDNREKR